ncbi:hypothetical protein JKP88DRAFT_155203, partial [Tribonema minus]
IAEARRLGVEVSSGGPPCTDFSMSGKRCSQKGIQCIISMLQVSAAVSTVRMVLLENVVGFLSTPEFQQALDLAQGLGFDHSHNVISGNDCGLPTKRRRVFIMFTRGRLGGGKLARDDKADWRGVHERL